MSENVCLHIDLEGDKDETAQFYTSHIPRSGEYLSFYSNLDMKTGFEDNKKIVEGMVLSVRHSQEESAGPAINLRFTLRSHVTVRLRPMSVKSWETLMARKWIGK